MTTVETEKVVLRRLAAGLSVAALLACGFFLWLTLAHGVSYLGPVPTFAFWVLPSLAACWLVIWPQRQKATRQVRVMTLATTVVVIVTVGLSVLHGVHVL